VAASCAIDAVLDDDAAAGRLTGPLLAREVWAALGPDETLVAAASNPIRDLDLAAHPAVDGTPPAAVHAHRGLSGIDGTVSTALGVGLTGRRVRVLIGDVAFLHDAGALLAAPGELRPAVQVVVLNDDGGGIFGLLEYGALAETGPVRAGEFERLFGTPHGADLASLCRGYGVRFERVIDTGQLRQVLEHPMSGLSVVEVRADRAGLRELHARLRTAAHAAIIITTTTAGRGRGG
jgi:2-succinyl-5-enolpyruvyl-6-hydroxy-3-cyclohexene-1-carboxylate synthase